MKYAIGCFFSAVIGGLVVSALDAPSAGLIASSEAQVQPNLTGPRIIPPTPLPARIDLL